MPKKACCCRQPAPEENSCCRPIYQACVGKKYTFEVLFKAKYPCFKNNPNGTFREAEYRCQNNGSLHSIPGNAETFILTIEYEIEKPANLYWYPKFVTSEGFRTNEEPAVYPCGTNYGCFQDRQYQDYPDSWVARTYTVPGNGTFGNQGTVYSCVGCDCYIDPEYSICNFGENDLNSECTCFDGGTAWIYNCLDALNQVTGAVSLNRPADPGEAICGSDPFSGAPYPYRLARAGTAPTKLWNQCYSFWRLQKPDTEFQPFFEDPPSTGCYRGCTFKQGDVDISNIPQSYSFQFIPDPGIPEQNAANYEPRLQPDLLNFNVICNQGDFLTQLPQKGYSIVFDLGIGYKASFNCGNNVTEILDIPFQRFYDPDDFINEIYNDGIYVRQYYRRSSLTNDPMNSCVPNTTYNYPYTTSSCINGVTPNASSNRVLSRCGDPQTGVVETLYKDEWSNCLFGPPIPVTGSENFGLFSFNNNVKMNKSCDSGFLEVNWSNHCEYFNLTDDIIVDSN
jgi:hypothetical protein